MLDPVPTLAPAPPTTDAALTLAPALASSVPFLNWLEHWTTHLAPAVLTEVAAEPARVAVISVDIVNGFCYEGPLASPRVAGIVAPIRALFQAAYDRGVRRFVLAQDTHDPAAPEFAAFPAHCVRGTAEAETVAALRDLPWFAGHVLTIEKNSIAPDQHTGFDPWFDAALGEGVHTYVVVGDCTDLCTYNLALHLKLRANAAGTPIRVIVPADCVQTYDLPVATAAALGVLPHDGDLLHAVFLYHMALNGVEVVSRLE